MKTKDTTKIYRLDIQALRGLAVLAVVLFHAFKHYFPLGYLGVDVFFIISGFVVTPLILRVFIHAEPNKTFFYNLGNFYNQRIYRLLPALGVILTISLCLIFTLATPGVHFEFSIQGIFTLLLIGNFGAFKYSRDYFSSDPNPLIHTWSLSVEEQIYIILPIIICLVFLTRMKIEKQINRILIFVTIISLTVFIFPNLLMFIYSKFGFVLGSQINFYSPLSRIWQFTIGGIAYIFLNQKSRIKIEVKKVIKWNSVILLLFILFSSLTIEIRASSFLASLFTLIVIGFRSLEILPHKLNRILIWLGDRSYSIYLFHMPLIYLAQFSPAFNIGNFESRDAQSLIAVFLSLSFGSICYKFVENRYRKLTIEQKMGWNSLPSIFIIYCLLPLALFVIMNLGASHKYWGLDKSEVIPVAWGVDVSCQRLNSNENDPPCVYGKTNSNKTVLLIGDSHAAQFSQALIEAAGELNWKTAVWTMPACSVQFRNVNQSVVYHDCLKRNLKIINWIRENKPDAVIISQYVTSEQSQIELRRAISEINLEVPSILLVANTPVFPDVMFPGHLLFDFKYLDKTPKVIRIGDMNNTNLEASMSLQSWAHSLGIQTVDFTPLFCNEKICSRWSEKGWLFSDSGHLSLLGANMCKPYFANFFSKLGS